MNILHWKEFVLGTILLLAIGHCSASEKRDAANEDAEENDLNLSQLADQIAKIPDIGPTLKDMMNYMGEMLMVISQLLNSTISRLMGGSLPCEMGPKNITCSGTSKEGGVFGIVEGLMDQVVLPDFAKKMMMDMIKRTINPIIDTLFGGLPLPNTNI